MGSGNRGNKRKELCMLYIMLFLIGCYIFHYQTTKRREALHNNEAFLLNDGELATRQSTAETEIII